MPITLTCMLPHPPLIVPAVGRGEERNIQKTIEPPCTERYARWCERAEFLNSEKFLLLDYYLYYHDLGKINVTGKSGLILVFALTSNDKCVTIRLKEMI